MLPEEHKSNLIASGIQFLRTITEAYGSTRGMEMWEKISEYVDPELKGQIFFALLTGGFETSINVTGLLPVNGQLMLIYAIKEVRAATGWGLKEAKDFVEMVRDGKQGVITCDPKNRSKIINNLNAVGLVTR